MKRATKFLFAAAVATLFAGTATAQTAPAGTADTVEVHADRPGPVYNRRLFGQFAEHLGTGIYGGIWVGKGSKIPNVNGYRRDVLDALKAIRVPVIRWPGGCYADEYHWREGVGPQAKRLTKVNTNWGGVTEDNSFGTHEFMNYSEMVGAEAYVSGNVGSASPSEMAEWVEYMTFPSKSTYAEERRKNGRDRPWKLAMFGIGNELWGCGGNMRPEYAADVTRRYSTFLKVPAGEKLQKIASGANSDDYNWTEVMMRDAGGAFDGIGVHYYTIPGNWDKKGAATGFDEESWARTLSKTLKMEELLTRHSAIMDKYDPNKRVALLVDEWGTWYDVEPGTNPGFLYQQNSLRDAMVTSLNLDIFARHADRVRGANIAQMINVLQAMILTDGARMVKTPTYWVFDMYKDYQDATVLPVDVQSRWYNKNQWVMKAVSASAVRDKAGVVHVGLTNVDPNQPATVSVKLDGVTAAQVSGRVLTGATMDAHNSFDAPNQVAPQPFNGATLSGGTLTVQVPAKSVVMLDLR
ncbi:alpha-N-arabinofuranosidase [Sphingomonas sp. Leaf257]|jgi:alpha-N-arabinofuranosidase|uniref:alpha-N-arabinofuranosidase n=1 Tax=Sphingomonas sp. Leaf257 TaxID=1736309 RepID=UPI0006F7468C|nr:alpha-L-arabinofuranosidase C-terminal domain-containing protein [Sphingomonas sp. Leaf257]KQO50294.1 alpha-N-arabinofuranosidase [Sphingomonas sp. Leaf257]